MPASTLPSVDLPAPFSPISPWHSPRPIPSVTSFSAVTPPKVLVIELNWIKSGMSKAFITAETRRHGGQLVLACRSTHRGSQMRLRQVRQEAKYAKNQYLADFSI